MDQSKLEAMVKNILSEELGKQNNATDDSGISPLLKDIRDSVQAKITNGPVEDGNSSSLLENIKNDVEKSIN
ncbi:hypothetical protein [Limosilactobacillus sp.]|jgi:hypothetical protein|uniref:hypothetical protein n=1 Tax=Limosilactobacillus sp. TaxID=2773925 RepID=UPI00359F75CF